MKFTTSCSPATMAFTSMKKEDLNSFYAWFMTNLPYCIEELMQLVRSTTGFERWNPDYSVGSLGALGEWFATKVQKRDLTQAEIEQIKSRLTKPTDVGTWDLSDQTKSLAVYVGMYYGQVAIENNPGLKWEQQLGSKNLADFGQPVVTGSHAISINPVRVASSFAFGLIDGTKKSDQLRKYYEYWAELKKPG